MPHEVTWHDDAQSIIRIDIHTEGTWDEIHAAVDKAVPMLANAPHRVDVIFNSKVRLPPGNPLPQLKRSNKKLSAFPNLGLFVSVSPRQISPFIKLMIDIIRRAYGMDNRHYGGFVGSLDEAQALILKDRAKAEAVT